MTEQKSALTIQRGDASIFVKSDPADASIYIDGKLVDGRTPVVIENLTPGTHRVQIKKAEIQASSDVSLISNKVISLSLKLAKMKTALKITGTPFDAEVSLDKKRSLSNKPSRITPAIFYDIAPGAHQVALFKVGYADTTFVVTVKEYESNEFSIPLIALTDDKQILAQKRFVKHRSLRAKGRILIIGSLGSAAAGGVLSYLAYRDYKDADNAKNVLDQSSIQSGTEYDRVKQKYIDKTNAGNIKTNIAIGIYGVAGACGILGLVLYF